LFSGTKLGRDLTWPKLIQRWADLPSDDTDNVEVGALPGEVTRPTVTGASRMSPAQRCAVIYASTEIVQSATAIVGSGQDVEGIAHAAGEVLAVLTRGQEGYDRGPLGEVSDCYDRAARTPHRVLPREVGPFGMELRHASRQIARIGALSGRGEEKLAVLALLLALAALIAEIAAWQQARGRLHQAAPAHQAADALSAFAGPAGKTRQPAAHQTQAALPGTARQERPSVRSNAARLGGSRPARPASEGSIGQEIRGAAQLADPTFYVPIPRMAASAAWARMLCVVVDSPSRFQ
jgi:hypothetical protein